MFNLMSNFSGSHHDCAHPLSQSPSLMEGLGVAPLLLIPLLLGGARGGLPFLANAAGDTQAGGDGGQDGRNGLNDEFPSFLLHGVH